jgi:hypothetical protein
VQTGDINLLGLVADRIHSQHLNQTDQANSDAGFVAKLQYGRGPRGELITRELGYAAIPNSWAMKSACATASSLASHLTLPFRIIWTASMPCNVLDAP